MLDSSARRALVGVTIFVVIVFVSGAITLMELRGAILIQFMLLTPLFLVCAAHPGLRQAWANLGRERQGFLVVVCFLVLLAPATNSTRKRYPFVNWYMYGRSNPPPKYVEYRAEYVSGEFGEFPSHEVVASSAPRAFMARFQPGDNPKEIANAQKQLSQLIGIYNRRRPDKQIRAVDAIICHVPLNDFKGEQSIQRTPFLRAEAP